MIFGQSIGVLVYAAFGFDFYGFLARDELMLRFLMLMASALYLVYYYVVAGDPLWDAIITNGALAAVNLAMICVVITERTTFSMSAKMAGLYSSFSMLSPGQFRRLMRIADLLDPDAGTVLTREGAQLDRLYFIAEGAVELEKAGEIARIEGPAFIGEVAFITGSEATATARTTTDTSLISWDQGALQRLFRRRPAIQVAIAALLNTDLAHKVARSRVLVVSA